MDIITLICDGCKKSKLPVTMSLTGDGYYICAECELHLPRCGVCRRAFLHETNLTESVCNNCQRCIKEARRKKTGMH